jgi:hypothetical protein
VPVQIANKMGLQKGRKQENNFHKIPPPPPERPLGFFVSAKDWEIFYPATQGRIWS